MHRLPSLLWISLLLLSADSFAANHCVILQYHHFSEQTPASTSVTPEQFAAHLEYLAQNDFNVLPLRDVVLSLHHQLELPDKCVSLTVDDAYQSVYTQAWPLLKPYGFHMTIFVNSEAVDKQQKPYMNWSQMRELSRNGFGFENHGHAHLHMIRKHQSETDIDWLKRIGMDIRLAQKRITDEIDIEPVLFAFPYGEYTPELLRLIEKLGFNGFGQQSGPAWPDANSAALPRFPMAAHYANLEGFRVKVNTLPLPVVKAEPENPLLAAGENRPTLTLQLASGAYDPNALTCYVSGSAEVDAVWDADQPDTVHITPRFDLDPGRHRTNCTMPSNQRGRFHWYSHNWFIRHGDGSWYQEY